MKFRRKYKLNLLVEVNKRYSGPFETIELEFHQSPEPTNKLNVLVEVNKRYSGPFETIELNEIFKENTSKIYRSK